MKQKKRNLGIDLFRGIAMYAVVILHSDEGISATPQAWDLITNFAGFAVPFFLATAFYLAINKLYLIGSDYKFKNRLPRLVIPYLCWSVLYLVYKVAKYSITNEFDQIIKVFQDRLSIIFLGGAAFHLYFLPLLITGTLLIKVSEFLIKRQVRLNILIVLGIISFVFYQLILISGNSFALDTSTAFSALIPKENQSPLIRLILVAIAWIVRCLPYIFTATLISHPKLREKWNKPKTSYTLISGLLFVSINLFGGLYLPQSIYEVVRGFSTLLFAIYLSNNLKDNSTIANLAQCSFGIYLIHLIFVETFWIIASRLYPEVRSQVSTLTLLTVSIVGFGISWIATSILLRIKLISSLMFGIQASTKPIISPQKTY